MIGLGLWIRGNLVVSGNTVESYFDHPPAYPGNPWTFNGRTVSPNVIEAIAGPAHCGWESLTMLFVGWPLGTEASGGAQQRQYIRDPHGQLGGAQLDGTWSRNPALPPDAVDTGYRYGSLKLYFAPSDEDRYAYLVAPKDSERWPRSDPLTLCD